MRARSCGFVLLLLAVGCAPGRAPAIAAPQPADDHRRLAREILAELIPIRSIFPENTQLVAQTVERRLRAEGFPAADIRLIGPEPARTSVVVRLRGGGTARPVLLMAHLDVVDAAREDWTVDPFTLTEQEGYFYGRGTLDNKGNAAILLANLIRLHREGFAGARDLIAVLTTDEEVGGAGLAWLLQNHRELVDAGFALNADAGGVFLQDGRPVMQQVQVGEKVSVMFELEVRGPGGHSSAPREENAIYQLAEGLTRLAAHRFPVRLDEVTRSYLRGAAALESDAALAAAMREMATATQPPAAALRRLEAVPELNALLRTTCVATRVEAGHADNALPQSARATVNCRLLPDDGVAVVEQRLREILADTAITVERGRAGVEAPMSPLRPDVMGPVERLTQELYGVPVMVFLSPYGTDGAHTRAAGIPTYGIASLRLTAEDEARAHGRDERIEVRGFYEALEFWYRLLQEVGAAPVE